MTGIKTIMNNLLFITAVCCALITYSSINNQNKYSEYNDDDYDGIEVIVVSKTPRGAYAGEVLSHELRNIGWYDIGLSRNGEEPIEYIWRADDEYGYSMLNARIGERGTINLRGWAKERNIKLRRPNAENPPIIGALGEVYWKRQK
jgi:hypothetical protein